MYKDKMKQREAVRDATRRYRARRGITGITTGITNKGITVISSVIPVRPAGISDNQWNYIKFKSGVGG